jgi:hypothetical protein
MPCIFCIAALAVAAGTFLPALLDNAETELRKLAPDLKRLVDTESVAQWRGEFGFTASEGGRKRAAASVTVYRPSGRTRIQVLTHDLAAADVALLEETIAGAMGARIVSRHDAHHGEIVGDLARQQELGDAIATRQLLGDRTPER